MSTTEEDKTKPIQFEPRVITFESGGVKFVIHIAAEASGVVLPPPGPSGGVTPVPPPIEPQPGAGLDGVLQMFAENKNAKAKPFYIDLNNPDKDPKGFAVMYGGDQTKFEKTITEGKITFVRNMGHAQKYASGAPPGKSCRFHISAGKNMRVKGSASWKDKPLPAFVTASDVCYYSHEMTVIARVGKALGTHQSFAFKVNSRPDNPDDTLRSTIEFCMNNDQKKAPYVNYNYAHAGYSGVTGIKQYSQDGKIEPNKWIGVKYIHLIGDDKKSTWMALYVNTSPIDEATGQPDNKGWKLKSEYTAVGIKEYQNIPPVWGGDSYLRVDGYDYVDLFRYSQVEILKGPLTKLEYLEPAPGVQYTLLAPEPENQADYNSADISDIEVPQQDPTSKQ